MYLHFLDWVSHGRSNVYVFSSAEKYVWDAKSHGPNIVVLEEAPDTARRCVAKQYTDGIRGHVGFNKGRHTFKFTFNDKPWGSHCAIGVCAAPSKLSAKGSNRSIISLLCISHTETVKNSQSSDMLVGVNADIFVIQFVYFIL